MNEITNYRQLFRPNEKLRECGPELRYTLYEKDQFYNVTIRGYYNDIQNTFFMDQKLIVCNENLYWWFRKCMNVAEWKEGFDHCVRITSVTSSFLNSEKK